MKKCLLLLFMVLALPATAQLVSRDFQRTPLSEVLTWLNSQSEDYHISFIYDDLENQLVTIRLKNVSIPEAVKQVAIGQSVKIKTDDREIFVQYKKRKNRKFMLYGQTKNYLTHELLKDVSVTLMTTDSLVIGSSEGSHAFFNNEWYWGIEVLPTMQPSILKIEIDGYQPLTMNLPASTLKGTSGNRYAPPTFMRRKPKTVTLKDVVIRATQVKFYHRGDTLIFNADAFQLSEGSMLDALIRQMPGVELKSDGRIYKDGKYVESLLLNGEDFFKGDRKIMLDNLPAYMVKQVAVYERMSERERRLGKHLGESQLVMDVRLKRQYAIGWIANAEVGGGTRERWLARLFASRFSATSRITLVTNANNLNDDRKPGESTDWTPDRMPAGEKTNRMAGVDYNVKVDNGKLKLNGSVIVKHEDDRLTERTSQVQFLPGRYAWSMGEEASRAHEWSFSTQHEFIWTPQPLQGIRLTPSFSYRRWENALSAVSGLFNSDPLQATEHSAALLDSLRRPMAGALLRRLAVNRYLNNAYSEGHSLRAGTMLVGFYRGYSLAFTVDYAEKARQQFSHYQLDYPVSDAPKDYRNRYSHTHPDRTTHYEIRLDRDFWVADNTYVGFIDKFSLGHTSHEDAIYRLDELAGYGSADHAALGSLPSMEVYTQTMDVQNSFVRRQTDLSNLWEIYLGANHYHGDNKDFDFRINLPLELAHSKLYYRQASYNGRTHCNRLLFSPSVFYKKMWNKQQQNIEIKYSMTPKAPDIVRLIGVRNDYDPLNIQQGNPELKTTTQHTIELRHKNVSKKKMRGIVVWGGASFWRHALAMGYFYDRTSGVRTYRPENVEGNRRFNFGLDVMGAMNKSQSLMFNSQTRVDNLRSVDLITLTDGNGTQSGNDVHPVRSAVYTTAVTEDMKLTWQQDKLTVGLNANLGYYLSKSRRDGFCSQRVWDFHYGPTLKAELPFRFQVSTDLTLYSRRGYADLAANTNDLVWNARLSKSLLHGNVVLMLDGFDLFHQLSNVSQTMNSQGRIEVYRNVLPSYLLFHVLYRLNIKPKKL